MRGIYKRIKPPWNKGKKTGYAPWKGKKRPNLHSEESKKKISLFMKDRKVSNETRIKIKEANIGESSPQWKDENVGYSGIHKWVSRWKGKATCCENCGDKNQKRYEWANIDHQYRRILEDYISMCKRCHCRYDKKLI